jgi:GntR family transcriptional regulator/MocR family aminotransferase
MTFLRIDKKANSTLHHQLYGQLKTGLYEGMLRQGDRMPSSREMSSELGVSRNIVLQVFEQLTMEGFFEARTGAGTFISDDIAKLSYRKKQTPGLPQSPAHTVANPYGLNGAFRDHVSALEPLIPFQQSVPLVTEFPFDTWARISAAVHKNMHLLHLGYDDAQGYPPLRKALADHLRISRSINCAPDQIVITNGTRQSLHLAAEMLLNKGDQCWAEDPCYAGATSAIRRFGGQICAVPVTAQGMDVAYAIKNYPKARLAYVTPSHQFPIGSTMSLSERAKLLNYAKENRMWIIEDDYDSEYRYSSRPIPALQGMDTHGNVIYSGNLSKVLLPALRISYMVLPTHAMARMFATAKSVTDGQCNIITQAIASEFISRGHFSRHIRRMRLLYKKSQDELVSLVNRHLKGILTPAPVEAGMHMIAWLPEGVDAAAVANKAADSGIILSPVSHYCINATYPNGLIIGFSGFTYVEMETAVLRLKKALG